MNRIQSEAAYCASNFHKPEREPATAHGTWMDGSNNPDVWYCEKCASTAETTSLFTRDKPTAIPAEAVWAAWATLWVVPGSPPRVTRIELEAILAAAAPHMQP